MPSPVISGRHTKNKFYRRKDGAYVYKERLGYVKVGQNVYKTSKHYAKRLLSSDKKRRAKTTRKSTKKGQKYSDRYPQAYDKRGRKW